MPRDDASGFAGKPAMSGFALASRNSLRALRPLRSNRRDEYVNEALRARPQAKPLRRHRNRRRRVPPAAPPSGWYSTGGVRTVLVSARGMVHPHADLLAR
jgi:hypothetical protein